MQSTFRNRVAVNLLFGFSTVARRTTIDFPTIVQRVKTFESFPSADEREKCVRPPAVMLLVSQNF